MRSVAWLRKLLLNQQFNCCPLIWMFHSRNLNNKISRLLERPLRIAYADHGTIIWMGKTCKKVFCYMRDSTCRWLIVENVKYFEVMLNIFEFSQVKEIDKSWLVYVNKFSWIIQSCFLTETKNEVSASFFFLYFRTLLREK